MVPRSPVRRRLHLLPLPWLWFGRVPRWSTSFARVGATVVVMVKVGVVAVGAEAVVAFLPLRTWGFFQVLETPWAGGFFSRARVAPGIVVCQDWGCPKVPLGAAAGRRPGSTWLLWPGFAMASAPAVDFPRLVLEAGGFLEPEFERLEAGGPLLVVWPPPGLPAADAPGIPPAVAARPLAFGVPLPISPRYLESLPNVGFLPRLPPLGMIWNR